ncbi:MAG: hypothetical protein OHK0031_10050 [Anaerolineales bacterium]
MTLEEIITRLQLTPLTAPRPAASIFPNGGYTCDLLSCAMAGAQRGSVWVTLQAHLNIIAIAALLELSAIIITENAQPDPATLQKAQEQGVTLLSTPLDSYEISGKLWELGLR